MAKLKKPHWKQSAANPREITMLPELGHYESGNKSITLHAGDRFYAIVRVWDVNPDGEEFTTSNVFSSDTREGIQNCFDGFCVKYPDVALNADEG